MLPKAQVSDTTGDDSSNAAEPEKRIKYCGICERVYLFE